MSRPTPPNEREDGAGNPIRSPRTPRGGPLKDRVNFFEQLWSEGNRSVSMEDLPQDEVDCQIRRSAFNLATPNFPRSSSRTSDSSFEETYERLVEEGELNGAKVEMVLFEDLIHHVLGHFCKTTLLR